MTRSSYKNNITIEGKEALAVLKRGGIILYPTDTVWGIGCDATNADAVSKVYALKKREETRAMVCLVHDFKLLNQFIEKIPEVAYDILKHASKPTTIVYDDPIRVAENLIGEDNTLAIRVTRDDFCSELIKRMGRPLVSTSANVSGDPTPKSFKEISPAILNGVDYIVNLQRNKKSEEPSTIIRLKNDGQVIILRK